MSAFNEEQVLSVHHWTDTLFSFTTTRNPSFRFRNGERDNGIPVDEAIRRIREAIDTHAQV